MLSDIIEQMKNRESRGSTEPKGSTGDKEMESKGLIFMFMMVRKAS